jgi:MYXO-CTERM domain-containing protein
MSGGYRVAIPKDRDPNMRRAFTAIAVGVLAGLPALSNAAFNANDVRFDCTEALVINADGQASYTCQGDFSVTGTADDALLQSDTGISLSATGNLVLSHLKLAAPQIKLISAPGTATTPPAVTLQAGELILHPAAGAGAGGTLIVGGSGDITVAVADPISTPPQLTTVPEPGALTLAAAGLVGLLARQRRRRA